MNEDDELKSKVLKYGGILQKQKQRMSLELVLL